MGLFIFPTAFHLNEYLVFFFLFFFHLKVIQEGSSSIFGIWFHKHFLWFEEQYLLAINELLSNANHKL